jgi:hypothetical protein
VPDLDRPLARAAIQDFAGLNTNADPHDLKPGEATIQINCGGPVKGKLRSRPGLRFVDFSGGNGGTSADVQAVYPMSTPAADYIVYQRTDGYIILGADPA